MAAAIVAAAKFVQKELAPPAQPTMSLETGWNRLPACASGLPARTPNGRGVHEMVDGLRACDGRAGSTTEQARGLFHRKSTAWIRLNRNHAVKSIITTDEHGSRSRVHQSRLRPPNGDAEGGQRKRYLPGFHPCPSVVSTASFRLRPSLRWGFPSAIARRDPPGQIPWLLRDS
jgi:hypothetical protein